MHLHMCKLPPQQTVTLLQSPCIQKPITTSDTEILNENHFSPVSPGVLQGLGLFQTILRRSMHTSRYSLPTH